MLVASYAADHSEPDAEFRFIIDTIRAVQAAVQAAVLAQHWLNQCCNDCVFDDAKPAPSSPARHEGESTVAALNRQVSA
jgi:hypothetical protein